MSWNTSTGANGHSPMTPLFAAFLFVHGVIHLLQDNPHFTQKDLPSIGQCHVPFGAMEKLRPEFFFYLPNLLAQGRL